jgi:hypothetical protein
MLAITVSSLRLVAELPQLDPLSVSNRLSGHAWLVVARPDLPQVELLPHLEGRESPQQGADVLNPVWKQADPYQSNTEPDRIAFRWAKRNRAVASVGYGPFDILQTRAS